MTIRLIPGRKRRLLDSTASGPASPDSKPWYINDHTLVRDSGGAWHAFGIWHGEPADPLDETLFLHASAADLEGAEWTLHEPVLPARRELGETHVWAPHVIRHDGQWWMFYCGGRADHTDYRIELATSTDLFSWRHQRGPEDGSLVRDGFDARDPMVLRDGDRWLMYCTRTSTPEGGFHEVSVRSSTDLVNWSAAEVAYRSEARGTVGGPTESPFVVPVGEGYLLFLCESGEYDRTLAWYSTDPLCFDDSGSVPVDLDEHCAEIVADGAQFWVTGGGWGRGGLTIRPLRILT